MPCAALHAQIDRQDPMIDDIEAQMDKVPVGGSLHTLPDSRRAGQCSGVPPH